MSEPLADIPDAPVPLLILVLGRDEQAVARLLEREPGALLFCPGYDHDVPRSIAGRRVLFPMDLLSPDDIDGIYRSVFVWQEGLPSARVRGGRTLHEAAGAVPEAIWSWLYRLYPHVHIRVRLIETIAAAMDRFTPARVAIVGHDEAFPWMPPLVARAAQVLGGRARLIGDAGRHSVGTDDRPRRRDGDADESSPSTTRRLIVKFAEAAGTAAQGIGWTIADATEGPRLALRRWAEWIGYARLRARQRRAARGATRPPTPRGHSTDLLPAHLAYLGFIPPVGIDQFTPGGPERTGAPDRVDAGQGIVRVRSRSPFALRWGACPARHKVAIQVRIHENACRDGTLRLELCNGAFSDAVIIDAHGFRLASGGPVHPIDGITTVTLSLHHGKRTLAVGKTELARGRATIHRTPCPEGVSIVGEVDDGGLIDLAMDRCRISLTPKPPRRRRRAGHRNRRSAVSAPLDPRTPAEKQIDALRARRAAVFGRTDAPHAVLLLAGRNGLGWYFHPVRREWIVWDEYIEHVPEALIDHCRAHGWTMTIVYQGHKPAFDDERRSYSERYPGIVDEVSTVEFRAVIAEGRAEAERAQRPIARRLLRDRAFRRAFAHRGVEFFDQLAAPIADGLEKLAVNYAVQARGWARALEALAPDVVLGGRLEHLPAINAGAHAAGAPSVTVKLGISEEMLPSIIARRPDGTLERNAYPDLFLVWGEWQRRYLTTRLPQLDGRVAVSGRTRSDSFVLDEQTRDGAATRERLGYRADDRIILFGGTSRTRYGLWPGAPWGTCCMAPAVFRDTITALARLAEREPGVHLIVKPHPADDLDMVRDILDGLHSDRVRLITRQDGYHNAELLAASRVFVSSVSSMFAEAVMCDRVAVNLWTPDVNFLYERARTELYAKIAHSVDDLDTLADAVRRFLQDDRACADELARAKANLPELFGSFDGHNAQRAVALACEQAGKNAPEVVVTPAVTGPAAAGPARPPRPASR